MTKCGIGFSGGGHHWPHLPKISLPLPSCCLVLPSSCLPPHLPPSTKSAPPARDPIWLWWWCSNLCTAPWPSAKWYGPSVGGAYPPGARCFMACLQHLEPGRALGLGPKKADPPPNKCKRSSSFLMKDKWQRPTPRLHT